MQLFFQLAYSLFKLPEAMRQIRKPTQARQYPHICFMVYGRKTRYRLSSLHTSHYTRSARYRGAVANLHVICNAHLSRHRHTIANPRAPSNTRHTGNHAVPDNLNIVTYLNKIINLRAGPNDRMAKRRTVNGAVRTYLDIVANQHAPNLRYLEQRTVHRSKSKSIASQYHTRMKDATRPYLNSFPDHRIGINNCARTYIAPPPDVHARIQHNTIPKHGPVTHACMRTNAHTIPQLNVLTQHGRLVNTGRMHRPCICLTLLENLNKRTERIWHADQNSATAHANLWAYKDRRSRRRIEIIGIMRTADKRDIARLRFANAIDPGDTNCSIAVYFAAYQFGYLTHRSVHQQSHA